MTWPPAYEPPYLEAVQRVLKRGILTGGPETWNLEAEFAERLGVEEVVAVSSGTAALQLALMAYGVGHEDLVIVPAFGFAGTVLPILAVGATPVFVDVDPATYCAMPDAINAAITDDVACAIVVHLHGYPVDVSAVKCPVIEDACQAYGARLPDGRAAGSYGFASAFSLNQTKTVFGGEGGLLATDFSEIADAARALRRFGQRGDDRSQLEDGGNWKITETSAAIARVSLREAEDRVNRARHNASILGAAVWPVWKPIHPRRKGVHAFHKYRVLVPSDIDRDDLLARLVDDGVPATVWQSTALVDQPAFIDAVHVAGDYPNARLVAARGVVIGDEKNPLCGTPTQVVRGWAEKLAALEVNV